jgi:hypothetical protein
VGWTEGAPELSGEERLRWTNLLIAPREKLIELFDFGEGTVA